MEVNPSPIMPPVFPRIMEVNPSPITPPAETQPSVPISVEHPNLAAFIQYGISNLPVSNNPAMIRQKYSSIIRHSSLTKHMLHRNTNLQVIYQSCRFNTDVLAMPLPLPLCDDLTCQVLRNLMVNLKNEVII